MGRPLIALLLAIAGTAATPASAAMLCRGEEPFWAFEGDADRGVLATPEARTAFAGRLDALDWLPPGWLVWHGPGLTLPLRAEACSSTMAEGPAQSHRAVLAMDDVPAAAGCCTVADAVSPDGLAARADDGWTRQLAGALPAIGACVAAAGTAVPGVLGILSPDGGPLTVRLRTAEGGRQDCVVADGGAGPIDRVEPVAADAAALPGEGMPLYLPDGGPLPPVGPRLERLLANDGAPLGWLAYPR